MAPTTTTAAKPAERERGLIGQLRRQRADTLAAAERLADVERVAPADQVRLEELLDDLDRLDARIDRLSRGSIMVKREPLTYQREDGRRSFFRDLVAQGADPEAEKRLKQHGREMAVELAERAKIDDARLRDWADQSGATIEPVPWYDETSVGLDEIDRALADVHAGRQLTPARRQLLLGRINGPPASTGQGMSLAEARAYVERLDKDPLFRRIEVNKHRKSR